MKNNPGLNATYDSVPEQYDRLRQCWLNTRREQFISQRLNAHNFPGNTRVLELGSGTGWLLNRLANRFPHLNFIGVEPIQDYVDYARRQHGQANIEFLCSSAEQLDEKALPGDISMILSNDVLHHVQSLDKALENVTSLSTDNAHWLAIEPNALNFYAFLGQALKTGERNFWPRIFLRSVKERGWNCHHQDYLFLIPPFVRRPPDWLKMLERRLENVPLLGGGVAIEIELVDKRQG